MPKGLKQTSSIITISDTVTESTANTFTYDKVDLQLNVLDREVFVVLAIDIDCDSPLNKKNAITDVDVSVSTTAVSQVGTIANSNVLANKKIEMQNIEDTCVAVTEYYSGETPHAMLDYIGIIATNDFFLNIEGQGNPSPRRAFVRVWGYRAQADAATYAALVQSEVLSS